MTPDQRFELRVRVAIALFILFFAYFLAADMWMPMTPQSQLMRPVLRIAPRVSGQIKSINVTNDTHVKTGQLLFQIDPEPYRLAVQSAELAVEQANQENDRLDASLAAARAEYAGSQADLQELERETDRLGRLVEEAHTSRQQFDQTRSRLQAAYSTLDSNHARILELQAQRGARGPDNLRLRQAQNQLDQARLNLSYCSVVAPQDGTVSNFQLSPGAYVTTGTPVTALVTDQVDVIADFREKSLHYVKIGDPVEIVFDALPGRVFKGVIESIDAGVRDGQLDPNGDLAAPVVSDRWIRDAQRQRLHTRLTEPLPQLLSTGAKTTVQIYPTDNWLAVAFGKLQIRIISLIHFIY